MQTQAPVRRSSLFMAISRASVGLLLFSMTACAPQRIAGTGTRVEPPAGWVDYCKRHPEDKACS